MGCAQQAILVWRLLVATCAGSSLVGPGAVGSFQGGAGGRRFGGFARVTDPPVGFFLGGSSIREMNGLYTREHRVPWGFSHTFTFSYRHDYTGWRMCLVNAPEDVTKSTGRQTEWVLIDPDKADRFRHDGDQYIPGSGHRWSHVHRTKDAQPNVKAGNAVAQAVEDEEDELPWQVVGVSAEEMMNRLKRYFHFYKHEVQAAIEGSKLPALPMGGKGRATAPPEGFEPPKAAIADEADQSDSCSEGHASLANAEAELAELELRKGQGYFDWSLATLQLRLAVCHRRSKDFEAAQQALQASLALYPRYAAALEEMGKLWIDRGVYEQAIHSFETLLRVDRKWPTVAGWLVRAHTLQRRQVEQFLVEKPEVLKGRTEHCIAWRQTGGCSPTGLLEPTADKSCKAVIVAGNSGFCQCVSSGSRGKSGFAPATAGESNCDHGPFTCAEQCQERSKAEAGLAQLTAEAAQLASEVSEAVDAQACSLLRGGELPDWCHPNLYRVLGIRCDFPAAEDGDELKRAYKRRSLQFHPDKPGGSAVAFQRIADAHHVLLDPEKRKAFDEGADFPRKVEQDGSEGETQKEEVEKKYFPENFDFQPFGDPQSDRREAKARQERQLEQRRQEALAREAHQSTRTDL